MDHTVLLSNKLPIPSVQKVKLVQLKYSACKKETSSGFVSWSRGSLLAGCCNSRQWPSEASRRTRPSCSLALRSNTCTNTVVFFLPFQHPSYLIPLSIQGARCMVVDHARHWLMIIIGSRLSLNLTNCKNEFYNMNEFHNVANYCNLVNFFSTHSSTCSLNSNVSRLN